MHILDGIPNLRPLDEQASAVSMHIQAVAIVHVKLVRNEHVCVQVLLVG